MAENYMYYNPSSDCNTCISQYEYERLSEDEKKKYKRMDGSEVNITREDIIKNYREVNTEQDYKIRMLEAENQRLKEQLKDYKKVLRFYADGKHYHYKDGSLSIYIYKRRHGIIETDDGEYIESGKKAKEILEKWGKK